jgi:hypothetical protein
VGCSTVGKKKCVPLHEGLFDPQKCNDLSLVSSDAVTRPPKPNVYIVGLASNIVYTNAACHASANQYWLVCKRDERVAVLVHGLLKAKAAPPHAIEALLGRGDIAPTNS